MQARLVMLLAAGIAVTGCGEATDSGAGNSGAANSAATSKASKPRAAYCFFKDAETKGWSASRDAKGTISVKGKAYRSDSRYKAVLGPAVVTGASAELSPSIVLNDTGYAAPGNWWDISATIPDSSGVETVTVRCGKKTLAELKVAR